MPESIFGSLLNMVDKNTVGEIAHALGEPDQGVSQGMESSIAAVLGGLASKSGSPSTLRKILDMVPTTGGPPSWSQMARGLVDPASPLLASGKRLLPALFGNGDNAIISGLSNETGLPLGAISSLLAMAGPVVMGFINKRVRDTGMTMNTLGSVLQKETATIRDALPSGVNETLWPTAARAETVSPVVAQTVQQERSSRWVFPAVALAVAALALGLGWLLTNLHRPRIERASAARIGEANRIVTPTPKAVCTLPSSVSLPEGGVESRLFAFVQNPGDQPLATTWFNFDRVLFDTGSAKLRPQSEAQLSNLAAILNNCPNVHVTVAGFTDSTGNAEANSRLSENRAKSVVAQLVGMGVSRDCVTAEGDGEQNPVADNATAEGRAQNRRVAMRVTQR